MATAETPTDLARAADWIGQADALIVAAGAGMGVDSGLPDFRGDEGLWRAYPALGRQRLAFWQIANPQAFHRDARLAWGFYGHRLLLYRRAVPHPGFGWLRQWARRHGQGGWVFTSNVDGQFQRAGWDEAHTVQVHGSIHRLQCLRGCGQAPWSADGFEPQVDEAACRLMGPLPSCPGCGGLARPNILMFDDGGWQGEHDGRRMQALGRAIGGMRRPVVVEIGAGSAVPTVRHFSESLLEASAPPGARLVRINLHEPQVPPGGRAVGLPMSGLAALQALHERLGD